MSEKPNVFEFFRTKVSSTNVKDSIKRGQYQKETRLFLNCRAKVSSTNVNDTRIQMKMKNGMKEKRELRSSVASVLLGLKGPKGLKVEI